MTVDTFNGNPSTTIISYSSTTNASDETDIINFSKVSSLVCSIPKHNVLIKLLIDDPKDNKI